jgi:anhydro-N-acetylmuramic acid kinase
VGEPRLAGPVVRVTGAPGGTGQTPLPDYLSRLVGYLGKPRRLVLGLHSGTSTDGPTAALAEIEGHGATARLTLLAHHTYEYPADLRTALLQVMDRRTATVDRVCQADIAVGEFFAGAAHDLAGRAGITMADVDLIASSGQVTYQVIAGQREEHDWPGGAQRTSMLDLGDGGVIAVACGVPTVSGLRRKDNAVGGFGAPLVPLGDWVLFRDAAADRVIWNIGGICNATVVGAGTAYSSVWAFDAGPGNMVIDRLAAQITGQAYDAGGSLAAQGAVAEGLLEELMADSFVRTPPPKAAARQLFGNSFTEHLTARAAQLGLSPLDTIATATAFTAETIAFAQRSFIDPVCGGAELVFAGGGARNPVLMDMISKRVHPAPVRTSEELGVPFDCREVFSMMLIANETVHGSPGNCMSATGASRPVALGHFDFAQ